MLAGAVAVAAIAPAANAATFTVNTNADSSGVCDFSDCSLREAITAANENADFDVIEFNIGGGGAQAPTLNSPLPPITEDVYVDGTTQPGYAGTPIIVLNGSNAGPGDGLQVTNGDEVTIRGLVISGFLGGGIGFGRGIFVETPATNVVIAGNFIGTDTSGTLDDGNTGGGIFVSGAGLTTIGGPDAADMNIVSGNDADGIYVEDSDTQIQGNHVGTGIAGTEDLGNSAHGIEVFEGVRNRITENSVDNNALLGINLGPSLGPDPNDPGDNDTGTNNLQNFPVIEIATSNGTSVTVQGTLDSILAYVYTLEFFASPTCDGSGSGEGRVFLGSIQARSTNFAATFDVPVPDGSAITSTATDPDGNTSEFSACHTLIEAGQTLTVNSTADDSDGTCGQPSGEDCTLREAIAAANESLGFDKISFAALGGGLQTIALSASLPVITDPVAIDGTTHPDYAGAPRVVLDATDAPSTPVLQLQRGGSTIRALVVNEYPGAGISLVGYGDNVIAGNYIGTNAAGTASANPTADTGIDVDDSLSNLIGGTSAADRNVVSGHDQAGISFQPLGETGDSDNRIVGNYIGTNAAGDGGIGNRFGIFLFVQRGNTIGGAAPGEGNVISGNSTGIRLVGSNYHTVAGNLIGTAANGTSDLGNIEAGIRIEQGFGNTIGPANTIAFNGSTATGISIVDGEGPSEANRITENSIHSNIGLGIDLAGDGVTPNDVGDTDGGSNGRQNFPVITNVEFGEGNTIHFSLNSSASTEFRIEFFRSPSCDPTGHGEGKTFLGTRSVTTDTSGDAASTFSPAVNWPQSDFITATATDPDGNTSEFSACFPHTFTVLNTNDAGAGSLRQAILDANATAGEDAIDFALPGPGVSTIAVVTELPDITEPVVIDGTTQPGYAGSPLVFLNGSGPSCGDCGVDGFSVAAAGSGSTIRGLAIGNFDGYGVRLDGGTAGSVVEASWIGIRPPLATTSAGNDFGAIGILGSANNRVGGPLAAQRVYTGSNANSGLAEILITGPESTGNVVQGSFIGLAPDGTYSFDTENGVYIQDGASGNTIGGDSGDGEGNALYGFYGIGVVIAGAGSGNVVAGNRIGLEESGSAGEAPDTGISVTGTAGTVIGDDAGPGDLFVLDYDRGNVIAGAIDAAIRLGVSADGSVVAGNFLGTARNGTATHANEVGISVGDAFGNQLGPGNTIAHNDGDGVTIVGADIAPFGHRIVANSIHDNGGKGIELAETANHGLAAPEITSATTSTVSGTVTGPANTTFFVEVFRNDACDGSGSGEGETYVTFASATTPAGDDPQTATWSAPVSLSESDVVTTTSTNASTSDTSEFSECFVVGGGGGGATIDLEPSVASVEAGAAQVELDAIPPGALLATLQEGTAATPMGQVPMGQVTLAGTPMGQIPMGQVGFAGIASLLTRIPLSSVPLLRVGGWEELLAGTELQGVPLVNITLGRALSLNPLPPGLAPGDPNPVTLAELDVSHSPLNDLPAVTLAMGQATLDQIGLPGGLEAWCRLFSGPPIGCSGNGSSLAGTSLLGLAVQGAPMGQVPMGQIPMGQVPMGQIPMGQVPMGQVDLAGSPMGQVPMGQIPMGQVPMGQIPMGQISNPNDIIDCSSFDCSNPNATLADAEAAGAIRANAEVADLFARYIGTDFTLAQLLASLPDPNAFTLADFLLLLLPTQSLAWERLDLDALGVQRFATDGSTLAYRATFDVNATGSGTTTVAFTVDLPDGALYIPGSSTIEQVSPPGTTVPIPDPTVVGSSLEYELDLTIGSRYRLELMVRPGLEVGPTAAAAKAQPAGEPVESSNPANVDVQDTFEPNPVSAPRPISNDSLYLSYLTSAADSDFYSYPIPATPGTRVTIRLSHLGADFDLVAYAPAKPQLRPELPGTPQLDSPPLEDDSIKLTNVTDALPPEILDDIQIVQTGLRPVGISALRRQEDEAITVFSTGETGSFTIQVTGYGGASSSKPYMLRVEETPARVQPACVPRPLPFAGSPGIMPALPANLDTVFAVNKQQLERTYGADAQTALSALSSNLAALSGLGFPSAVIPVEADGDVAAAYNAWNDCPTRPELANAVVREIGSVLDGIRAQRPTLRHVVLVGGDDIVPHARIDDLTTLANEYGYADTFDPASGIGGSLLVSRVLTDDPYVDLNPVRFLDGQLHVPDLAVGRLVETPQQIADAVQRFVAFDGELDPQSSLSVGYDFLTDGAMAVHTALARLVGAANASQLISDSWSRQDLLDAFLPAAGAPGLSSVNGHADHNRLLPAAGNATGDESDLFTVDDVQGSAAALDRRVVFSMGCHAGLSPVDVFVADNGVDWAQTYSGKGATYLGNTGYGYGDTVAVAYSEELNRLFAGNLSNATLTLGEAAARAKDTYSGDQAVFSVYDAKAMAELTLYGMPMYKLAGAQRQAPEQTESERDGIQTVDPITGLDAEPFSFNPTFETVTTPRGSYLRNAPDDGIEIVHLRPIQPRLELDLTDPDVHGALITELTSSDTANWNPVYARPTVDLAADEPELPFADVAFPTKLQTITTSRDLVLITGQFFSDGTVDNNGVGVQRRFTHIAGHTFSTTNNNFVPPRFERIEAVKVGNAVAFSVDVVDDQPATVKQVLVAFRDGSSSTWDFVDLGQLGGSDRWTGGASVSGARIEYFVQAVDSAGNVGASWNKGFLYEAAPPPPPPSGGLETELDGPEGDNGWYTGPVTLTVTGPEGFTIEVSVDAGPFQNYTGPRQISGAGVHAVDVRASNGGKASLFVRIDGTPPEIVIGTPADGSSYAVDDSVDADYECVDAGSGSASCTGTVADGSPINTATPGPKTFTVEARDIAGNTSSKEVTYAVGGVRDIVFASTRDGDSDVYRIRPGGSGLEKLTNDPGVDTEPAWSHDASKIAFVSNRDGDFEIFVMNADGSGETQLTSNERNDISPEFSPNGQKIVFARQMKGKRKYEIFVMNADGSGEDRLTTQNGDDADPTWSRDGSKIAFTSKRDGNFELYVMNADGTGQTRLTDLPGEDVQPAWSPTADVIAFTRKLPSTNNLEVFVIGADGQGLTQLTSQPRIDAHAAWSRDGLQLVFDSNRIARSNFELFTMQADGDNQDRITTEPGADIVPDW